MTQTYQTFTVYLGSSGFAKNIFKNAAIELGETLGKQEKHLVYGGMDAGLMGLVARSALEQGGKVTGIIPEKIRDSERILKGLSKTIMVDDLWDRKKRMFLMADAIIALPGGFGTLDEALEVLYWGNLGLHNRPLILVNINGFWDGLIEYVQKCDDFDPAYLLIVNGIQEIFSALEDFKPPKLKSGTPDHYPHFEDEITRDTNQPIIVDKATIENSYYLVCALGLKQLGKHKRAIGILNSGTKFYALNKWFKIAKDEKFITNKCLQLYDISENEEPLRILLKQQNPIDIDLHKEKWG